MSHFLSKNSYGKSQVRLTKVTRHGEQHELMELSANIELEGEFAESYTAGDNSRIVATDTMKNTMGYWLRFDSSSTFKLAGPPVDSSSIPLVAGWNLIGSIAIGIDTSSISSTPPGIISSKIYGYDHRYLQVSDLEPGKGYWIKARAPGILNLNLSKNKPRAGK